MTEATAPNKNQVTSILIPVAVADFLEDSQAKVEAAGLTKPDSDFLHGLLGTASEFFNDDLPVDAEHITLTLDDIALYLETNSILGHSVKSVRRKLYSMTETGFFKVIEVRNQRGGHPSKKFILHKIHKKDFETADQKELRDRALGHRNARTKSTKVMLKYLRESAAQLVTHFGKSKPITETIYTGLFDRCMRFTTSDKIEGNRITSKIRIKNTDILVQATTQTGPKSELAALPDQRVIRAVITEVAHFIDSEIDRYILEAEKPRQSSLFGDEKVIGALDLSAYAVDPEEPDEQTDPSNEENSEAQSFESKFDQRRAELERSATERVHNDFFLDTLNIAKRMEYASPHSGSTRRFINSSLRRLYDTSFRMLIQAKKHEDAIEIMELFDVDDLVTDFRFLPTLKSQYDSEFISEEDIDRKEFSMGPMNNLPAQVFQNAKDLGDAEKEIDPYNPKELSRVRVWRVSLDPHLFEKLLVKENRKLFTAHSDIMKEGSGLAQTLYNLFTTTIGRENKRGQGKRENSYFLPLADLHNILWPTRKYHRFEEEFVELMQRYATDGWDDTLTINSVSMFGYRFTLMKKGHEGRHQGHLSRNRSRENALWVKVERDIHDKLAGDQSFYNRQKTKKTKASLSETQTD